MESLLEEALSECQDKFEGTEVSNDITMDTVQTDQKALMKETKRNQTKVDRKNSRKCLKMEKVVSKQVQVKLSPNPNKCVVVWGIGMANGIGKDCILSYFSPTPEEVRLLVDKTYVFLRFSTVEDAVLVREKYDGIKYDEKQTLYVGFIHESADIPEEDIKLLKPFEGGLPQGLTIYPDFISEEQEQMIISNLFMEASAGSNLKKRTVQHFGYEFRYGSNDVDICTPLPQTIPDYILPIISKMIECGAIESEPDQITVNQYSPGQGIPPHCDTHSCFEGPIVSLSIASDIVMDFRQVNNISSVILPAKSLLVMDGPSRYGWTHGITPRKYDIVPDNRNGGITILQRQLRISLTFRRLKRGATVCNCNFPSLCDTQKGKITSENAMSLENDLVHKVYEEIASHFTETRHKPWPKIKEFVENLKPGDRMLDVGCANGKYFGINKDILEIGNDMSAGLLQKCHEKGHEVIRANALILPFYDNCFEAVISIAVLHHIATKDRRVQFLEEILRVMAPGGLGLIYVWAKEQARDDTKSTWSERQLERNAYNPPSTCVDQVAEYSFLPIHDRDLEFPKNDMLVPWVDKQNKVSSVHHRYYHVFDAGELEGLVAELRPAPIIRSCYYEQGNWVVMMQKHS